MYINRQYYSKPDYSANVDRSDPLAANRLHLLCNLSGSNIFDGANNEIYNAIGATSNITTAIVRDGKILRKTGAANASFALNSPIVVDTNTPWEFTWRGQRDSNSDLGVVIGGAISYVWLSGNYLEMANESGGYPGFINLPDAAQLHTYTLTSDGAGAGTTTLQLYIDSALSGSVNGTSTDINFTNFLNFTGVGSYTYNGDMHFARMSSGKHYNAAMVKALHDNIYRDVERRKVFIPQTINGAVLSVADAASVASLESINVLQNALLSINDTISTSFSDVVAMLQAQGLTVSTVLASTIIDNVNVSQQHSLASVDALSNPQIDNIGLSQQHNFEVSTVTSNTFADAVVVTAGMVHVLIVDSAYAATQSDVLGLTQQHSLPIDNILSSSTIENVIMSQANANISLVPLNAVSSSFLNDVLLSQVQQISVSDMNSQSFVDAVVVALATLGKITMPGLAVLTPEHAIKISTPQRDVKNLTASYSAHTLH